MQRKFQTRECVFWSGQREKSRKNNYFYSNLIFFLLIFSYCTEQLILSINFSSRTTSMDVQRNLEANVEKRTKDTYGPPPGRRLLVFMDDMNMPQVFIGVQIHDGFKGEVQ